MSRFVNFKLGDQAEALDEFRVWTPCVIISKQEDTVKVSFTGWASKWDRVVREEEVRSVSPQNEQRSARKTSYKVNLTATLRWTNVSIIQMFIHCN